MEDLPNATSSTWKILKKLGIGRADFNTTKNTHIKPRANLYPTRKKNKGFSLKSGTQKRGPLL